MTAKDSPLSVIRIEHIDTFWNKIKYLRSGIEHHTEPHGTKKYPASSCGEIRLVHDDFEKELKSLEKSKVSEDGDKKEKDSESDSVFKLNNGSFWIDPNRGFRSDAFKVQCQFLPRFSKSCVNVKYDEFGIKNLDISLSQFNFLFWHSLKVEQNLNIECKNVLITDKLLKKGTLFETYEGINLAEPEIIDILNNCKVSSRLNQSDQS